MANALVLVIQRLLQTPSVGVALGPDASKQVFAVHEPEGTVGRFIIVNRLSELEQGDNTQGGVAVTCFAEDVAGAEEIGAATIVPLDEKEGQEPFSFGDAKDVQFLKVGPDVTGYDVARRRFLRSIEFSVTW